MVLTDSKITRVGEDYLLTLPDVKLDRKEYLSIANELEGAGGKWSKKHKGFIFELDPAEDIKRIVKGEKINKKKEIQFFPTPEALAIEMLNQTIIYTQVLHQENLKVLEPSAGRGSLIKAIWSINPKLSIDVCEIDELNKRYLRKLDNERGLINHIQEDFLELEKQNYYDLIFANPPFSKNQDIDHVYKMFDCLKEGGTLGSFTSKHWQISSNKKEVQFRNWLEESDYTLIELNPKAFKETGTMIATNFIIITKSKSKEAPETKKSYQQLSFI